jgi:antitoxin component YwqK of YwqJK toxin-antitoxin module
VVTVFRTPATLDEDLPPIPTPADAPDFPATSVEDEAPPLPAGFPPPPPAVESLEPLPPEPTPSEETNPFPVVAKPAPRSVLVPTDSPAPELIQQRGLNGRVQVERTVRQDAKGNYILHGEWRSYNAKGALDTEGYFENNQRHGTWRRMLNAQDSALFATTPYTEFQGPFVSQVQYERGKLHGSWIVYDARERKVSEIEYTNGQRHGSARWWHAEGHLAQELHFTAGRLDGDARLWDAQGQVTQQATYKDGRRVGVATESHANQQKKLQVGVLAAPLVIKTPDDWWAAKHATYETLGTDIRHGHYVSYHPNGMKQRQGEYEQGLPVGKTVWWHSNGQRAVEGYYHQGKAVGTWNWWYDNGQKATTGELVEGAPTGEWSWWKKDGTLAQKADLSKGKEVARSGVSRSNLSRAGAAAPQPAINSDNR